MRVENSFIPVMGVGEKTERRLWQAGVTHWDDFDGSVVGPVLARRIRLFIDLARERLDDRDAGFFGEAFPARERWRLYEEFREGACFLDIETTGLGRHANAVTVVGFHRAGETTTLVRGDDLTRDALVRVLSDAELLVTFNGARFDVPFLETAFDLDLGALGTPHLDLLYPCRRLDLTGGLKRIEQTVGIDRDLPNVTGEDAVRLWRAHERGYVGALETLLAYNREDAENLLDLADLVCGRLHEEVFASVRWDQ